MKINSPRSLLFMCAVLLLGSCGGCSSSSSASAPPIDLPAPITGRITISEPDVDGNVTITGSEGAVTAGATVIAVNETVAGAQSLRILDALIPSAYAQAQFPAVCSQTGRACATADANGAFVIVLAASRGDSIAIGLIDPTSGEYVSELVRSSVPTGTAGGTASAACAGLNLAGTAVDLIIVPGEGTTTITLLDGSETATNRVVIRTATATNTVDIDGCYAASLAVTTITNSDGTTSTVLAATSSTDRILWTGTYSNGAIWNAESFTLAGTPSRLMFVGTSAAPLVAVGSAGTILLEQISLSTGNSTGQMALLDNANLAAVNDLDVFTMSDGQHLGLAMTADTAGIIRFVFFHADNLAVVGTFASDFTLGNDGVLWSSFIDDETSVGVAVIDNSPTFGPLLHIALPWEGALVLSVGSNIGGAFAIASFTTLADIALASTASDIGVAKDAAPAAGTADNNIIVPLSDGTLVAVAVQLDLGLAPPNPLTVTTLGVPLSTLAVSNGDKAIDVLNSATGAPSAVGDLFAWTN